MVALSHSRADYSLIRKYYEVKYIISPCYSFVKGMTVKKEKNMYRSIFSASIDIFCAIFYN